ncbi:glycerate kinase [Janthinobacterium sp. SUN118]|uniref:glycerate kinase type-2 family protein n=1 Tax=Janthinobacterium sp. SUN118 TaxID=3004100 RepID=UPI0025AF3410|nr:glycerate kinase [Janthinobacterium sp. SUN118]MDN2709904.1 glycerate kinase [Janthinobacterium sp. SUN118]
MEQIALLKELYGAALAAADPMRVLPAHLPPKPAGRTVVVGVGKAAAAMAQALEAHWNGPLSGVVAVPRGATLPLKSIRQVEASHPVPDDSSVAAGRLLMQAVTGLTQDDLVIALVSGGGSALCALPFDGVSLDEKRAITDALLRRGATIREINTVRKHLSAIKGGRLAAQAWPARVATLLISDIPGDEAALIASAPTLPDPSTCAQALAVLRRYAVDISAGLAAALEAGALESPEPGDARFAGHTQAIVACAQDGLEAAASLARARGWPVHILSDAMEGNAADLALAHAAIARQVQRRGQPFAAPCIVLSGGEATVTVRGQGRGGRNTEFALALAIAVDGQPGIYALSAGTDGLDGSGAAAGACIHPGLLAQARSRGLDPAASLQDNDSFTFFAALGSTVVTGPTHTNINDVRAVLIEALPGKKEQA